MITDILGIFLVFIIGVIWGVSLEFKYYIRRKSIIKRISKDIRDITALNAPSNKFIVNGVKITDGDGNEDFTATNPLLEMGNKITKYLNYLEDKYK